jgi:glutamyl-tRNA synthetase
MLRHINREHLKRLDDKELSRFVGFADSEIGKLAKLYLEEASTTKELKEKIAPIFEQKKIPEEFAQSAAVLKEVIHNAPYFETYDAFKKHLMQESGLKGKNFFKPLRYLLTGAEHGPEVKEIYEAIKNYIKEVVK